MLDLVQRKLPGWRRLLCAICVALGGLAASVKPAAAQVRGGAHGAYQTQSFGGSYGVGGRVEFDLSFLPGGLTMAGTFDHFFPRCTTCSANDVGLQLLLAPPTPLYLGAGTNYRKFDDGQSDASGEWTFNVIAGIRIPVLPVLWPYLEYRQQVGSDLINDQTISLGLVLSPARARNAPRRRPPR